MMELHLEDVRAEVAPVFLGVDEVQVPRLVDDRRRADGMAALARDEEEARVFLGDALGEVLCPAIFAGEAGGEAVFGIELGEMLADVAKQIILSGGERRRHGSNLAFDSIKASIGGRKW